MGFPVPPASTHPHRSWALTILLIPAALTLLSVTSINVALPAIRSSLSASPTAQSLIITAYALCFALVLLPAGKLGDRYGHKPVFIAGVLLFSLASLACGMAATPAQLIWARAAAGIGGGLAMTPVTALIQVLYLGPQRARPFGILGAVFGAASAAGPLMGGIMMQLGGSFGWRVVFLVNIPFGLLAAGAGMILLPRNTMRSTEGRDLIGMSLFSCGLVLTILPFSIARAFDLQKIALLCTGIAIFALFFYWVTQRSRRNLAVVISPALLHQPSLTIGMLTTFLGFASFTSSFLTLSLLWIDALGHSTLEAGLLVTPFAIGSMVAALANARLGKRMGKGLIVLGMAMTAIGMLAMIGILVVLPSDMLTLPATILPILVIGIGVGCFVGPNTMAACEGIAPKDAGIGSALVTVSQRAGTAFGVGILATLFATRPGGSALVANHILALSFTAACSMIGTIIMIAILLYKRKRAGP